MGIRIVDGSLWGNIKEGSKVKGHSCNHSIDEDMQGSDRCLKFFRARECTRETYFMPKWIVTHNAEILSQMWLISSGKDEVL